MFHVYQQNLVPHATTALPEPLNAVLANGYLGVYIFFVLSGFVIAYSVRDARVTPRYIGRFALRRSLRLDPPYWATIAAALALSAVSSQALPDQAKHLPSVPDVLAHLVYAQQLLGVPHILGVFWTLCLEIQFYLVYVVGVFVAQRLGRGQEAWVFGPLWILSLLVGCGVLPVDHAVFLWAWPYFFLGMSCAWLVIGRISTPVWMAIVASSAVLGLDANGPVAVAMATAVVIAIAARPRPDGSRWLQTVTLGPVLQYLGRISYSLYLTHLLVGSKSARLGIRLLGHDRLDHLQVTLLLVGCTALSIGVAHLMHVLVETPAMRWSQRISLRPRPA